MFNTINSIKVGCCNISKTLPLAFDESLSYLEMLCGILSKLNEVIAQTNENTDFIKNWDASLDEINKQLTTLENEFNDLVSNVNEVIDARFNEVYNDLLTMINNYINNIYDYIKINNKVIKDYIDSKDAELLDIINNIILKNIKVFNPTNGKIEDINKVINDLYNDLRYEALTCDEFDISGITTEKFDDLNLTCKMFELYGKRYIGNYYKYINLATGEFDTLQNILDTLFSYHQNGITTQAFDNLELTAEEFDSKLITAYEFDFHNPLVV